MRIIEPDGKNRLVRAGSLPQKAVFRDHENSYFVVLDMQENFFDYNVRHDCDIEYDPIWVFNVRSNTLGVFDEDEMVEPVELEVIVKEKE